MITLAKLVGHIKTVCTHKYWVGKYCFEVGLYWQGITHDLSKFLPSEFIESVEYWTGTCSPIDTCKKEKGYSLAWLSHKGRNKHHFEYWYDDNLPGEDKTIPMPFEYALELICDYVGAGRAYRGDSFTFMNEYDWWQTKQRDLKEKNIHINEQISEFISMCMWHMMDKDRFITREEAEYIYKSVVNNV